MQPIKVGIVGLGRSGWNIHVQALRDREDYKIVAVSDPMPERRQEAVDQLGAQAFDNEQGVFSHRDVELVVVASPSHLHADQTCAALDSGKHVLVEKPMANDVAEVDRMIDAATRANKLLSVYQIRRLDPDYLKIKEIIDSGVLGPIVLVRMVRHNYMRRSDWQTLKKFGGGMLNNWGAHIVDMGLQLIDGRYTDVFADMQQTVSAGDAEDHLKIVLKGESGAVIDVEVSSSVALTQPEWFVVGKYGTLTGSTRQMKWRYYDPAAAPVLSASEQAPRDRRYQQAEQLPWVEKEEAVESNNSRALFYDMLYGSIRRQEPLLVTAESVRQQIALFDTCRELTGF